MLDAAEGADAVRRGLLSTQYDDEGMPTRAGLELWPDDPDGPARTPRGSAPGRCIARPTASPRR